MTWIALEHAQTLQFTFFFLLQQRNTNLSLFKRYQQFFLLDKSSFNFGSLDKMENDKNIKWNLRFESSIWSKSLNYQTAFNDKFGPLQTWTTPSLCHFMTSSFYVRGSTQPLGENSRTAEQLCVRMRRKMCVGAWNLTSNHFNSRHINTTSS